MGAPAVLSHKHEAIIDYMLLNPQKKMSEVAAAFGLSQSWISVLTNDDLFKNELARRRDRVTAIVEDRIRGRMENLAEKGIDKLEDIIDTENVDPRLVHDVTKTALASLGFGKSQDRATTPAVQNNVQNNYVVSPEALQIARNLLRGANGSA